MPKSVSNEELEKNIYPKAEMPTEAGASGEGEIVDILWGKAVEFFGEKAQEPEADTIQFIVLTPDDYEIRITGKISMHPMAKFRKLTDALGHKPKIGDKVPLMFDGQFWRPAI